MSLCTDIFVTHASASAGWILRGGINGPKGTFKDLMVLPNCSPKRLYQVKALNLHQKCINYMFPHTFWGPCGGGWLGGYNRHWGPSLVPQLLPSLYMPIVLCKHPRLSAWGASSGLEPGLRQGLRNLVGNPKVLGNIKITSDLPFVTTEDTVSGVSSPGSAEFMPARRTNSGKKRK